MASASLLDAAVLPPRVDCKDVADADQRLAAYLAEHGGTSTAVLGTGSMAPWIPASPPGKNPKSTIVAYAVLRPDAKFSDIRRGDAVLYEYLPEPGSSYLHCAAELTKLGWIMSGIANKRSESWTRVTERNFKGIVACVFVWPQ